ncbi:hypothetical protein C0J52_11739 [Blattella germanica]|nr:hypothetical protein C0J52_11739 [Blattella germanica]
MRLTKFLLRYFPPGIALEYVQRGKTKTKTLDLLNFSSRTNVEELAATIAADEPLVTSNVVPQLVESLNKLQRKLKAKSNAAAAFALSLKKSVRQDQRESGLSYGLVQWIMKEQAMFHVSGDKILTGSFDKTAKLWSAETGECYSTLWGHTAEVVTVQFNPQSLLVGTSSMDTTARLYHIATGSLLGHSEEISNCLFNFDCSLIASSSMDKTAKVWDPRTFSSLATVMGHHDEVGESLSNPFELYGDDGFKARFRFSKETVMDIIRNIGHFLLHDTRGNPLPVALQFLITLRFLATGAFYAINADTVNIHPSTLCRTLDSVLAAINSMRRRVIHFPENDELRTIKHDFAVLSRDNFPGIIGAIDCTHVRITCSNRERAVVYINRKGFYSINCQVICDAKMRIRGIVARWPGSTHDSRIFRNSTIRDCLERGEVTGHLLGDSGYPCKKYLLTPILNPRNAAERRYNRAHVLGRNVVERTFGIWKKRFPCIAFGLRTKIQKTLQIIIATAVLHNLAVERGEAYLEEDIPFDDVPVDPPGDDMAGNLWRQLVIDNYFRN